MSPELVRLLLLIAIGGFIGYITNKIAIKMLFRPVNPVRIGPFTLQGVFPKRKDQMAISLAETIEQELLSKDVIVDTLLSQENIDRLRPILEDALIEKIVASIPPMMKMFLGEDPSAKIRNILHQQGGSVFADLLDVIKQEGMESLDIHAIVKERIDSLDFVEFERIVFGLMNRELRFVELIGLILGSVIGLLQFIITMFV
jgi:uncharacterized membrane protein YheB (UPF0754 family)